MIIPFLKPNIIIAIGEDPELAKIDPQKRKFYSVTYSGNPTKRGLILAQDLEVVNKLGLEITPHWNYPDSDKFFAAYGIKFDLHQHPGDLPSIHPDVANFISSSTNEDFSFFLNQDDLFGNE